jgi:hypothetical protein
VADDEDDDGDGGPHQSATERRARLDRHEPASTLFV